MAKDVAHARNTERWGRGGGVSQWYKSASARGEGSILGINQLLLTKRKLKDLFSFKGRLDFKISARNLMNFSKAIGRKAKIAPN